MTVKSTNSKPTTGMTMQECRDAVPIAIAASNWDLVVMLKRRIEYIRRVHAAQAKKVVTP